MKWHQLTGLCLLVFVLGVAVGIFATRSTPAPASPPTVAKSAPTAAQAGPKQATTPLPISHLERVAEAAVQSPSPAAEGARYLTSRPALPPVLEPVAKGDVAWRTDPHEWNNVGRQTVGAAIQSQYWAISRGELETLGASVHMDDDARAALQRLRDEASPKLREQFPTPESFAAFLLVSQPAMDGMSIGPLHPTTVSETDVTVSVALTSPGSDRFDAGSLQRYRRSDTGEWLRVIGPGELSQWRQMLKWDRELSKSRTWVITPRR